MHSSRERSQLGIMRMIMGLQVGQCANDMHDTFAYAILLGIDHIAVVLASIIIYSLKT